MDSQPQQSVCHFRVSVDWTVRPNCQSVSSVFLWTVNPNSQHASAVFLWTVSPTASMSVLSFCGQSAPTVCRLDKQSVSPFPECTTLLLAAAIQSAILFDYDDLSRHPEHCCSPQCPRSLPSLSGVASCCRHSVVWRHVAVTQSCGVMLPSLCCVASCCRHSVAWRHVAVTQWCGVVLPSLCCVASCCRHSVVWHHDKSTVVRV